MARATSKGPATSDSPGTEAAASSKAAPVEIKGLIAAEMPRLSRFQKFSTARIARRDITSAPYNPRIIDAHAKKKLAAIIRKKGLVSALTWNRRTGHVVGGHQRLSILDTLEGSEDYSLDVDVVDVDEREEVELNITLNNPSTQGSYDLVKLEELFEADAFNFEAVGFEAMDLESMFPESAKVQSLFALERQPAEVRQAVGELDELEELKRRESERMRGEKKAHREKEAEAGDTEWHTLVIFRDRETRERFMALVGCDEEDRYLDGRVLLSHLEEREKTRT